MPSPQVCNDLLILRKLGFDRPARYCIACTFGAMEMSYSNGHVAHVKEGGIHPQPPMQMRGRGPQRRCNRLSSVGLSIE